MNIPIAGPADLRSKVSIVTGAAQGIGQAICRCMAREGSHIIACDIKPLEETVTQVQNQNSKIKIVPMRCDISDEGEVRQVVSKTFNEFGRIDIFVGNAAIAGSLGGPEKSVVGFPIEEWDHLQHVNVRGTIIFCLAVWPIMEKQRSGKIILIGSLAGKVGGVLYGPYYAATKGAIHTLTKWLAKNGAPRGIYVNAIAPGPILTPMGKAAPFKAEMVPLGRLGEPEDIAEPVIFLASDASNFITGTILNVNGGMLME
jgi:3-oxoacyl-[acyl-carrier protein] reductase